MSEKKGQVLSSEPSEEIIREAVRELVTSGEFNCDCISSHGMENRVYKIDYKDGSFVLRINDALYAAQMFQKEKF